MVHSITTLIVIIIFPGIPKAGLVQSMTRKKKYVNKPFLCYFCIGMKGVLLMRGLAMSACGLLIIAVFVHYFSGWPDMTVIKGWLIVTMVLFVAHLILKNKKRNNKTR